MDQFNVTTKLWPSGANLDLGTDSNLVTVPSSFDRHASNFVTSMDGTHNYQFLFWDTGRHVTNRRHVRWNFSVGGWGMWTATRWYGTPATGSGGPPEVTVTPFTIGSDGVITGSGSPINGTASSYAPGAYPFNGDNDAIGTANGAVTVVANDPFDSLQFAGWDLLVWGGDDTGTFVETDTGATMGSAGFFPVGGGPYSVNRGVSANLLALYGNANRSHINWSVVLGNLGLANVGNLPPSSVDPAPDDIIRLAALEALLQRSQPVATQGAEFQRLIEAAPTMSAEQLSLAVKNVQTSIALGNTAVATLQAQLKAKGATP